MEDIDDLFRNSSKRELEKYVSNARTEARFKSILEQKFKKLKHKISYLNIEHEELMSAFKTAQQTFISTMFEYCARKNISPPFKNDPHEEKKKEKKTKKEIKELYREIVKQTHPDKTQNLSEDEIESRAELYHEASQGKDSGDFNKILKVALDLDIEIENVNADLIVTVEEEIAKMEEKISSIRKDLMYKWYHAEPAQKKGIFEQLTKGQKPKD
jgi:predicted component of type VI protein secretion system